MTIDQLFDLHRLMQDVLNERLTARKAEIETQLKILNQPPKNVAPKTSRDRKSAYVVILDNLGSHKGKAARRDFPTRSAAS